jgi:hypothetical protein
VLVETLPRCIGLGVLLVLGSTTLWSRETHNEDVPITVSVFDDAGVGLETMIKAEEISSYIFGRAGIEIRWLNCEVSGELTHVAYSCGRAVYPTNLQLRIRREPHGLQPDAFGISYLSSSSEGCYSEIFTRPVEALRERFPVGMATLLGHVATHEIAHLLLGSNSHSETGIMRARWGPKELKFASMGGLLFDHAESTKMTGRVMAGLKRNQEMVAATRADRNLTY